MDIKAPPIRLRIGGEEYDCLSRRRRQKIGRSFEDRSFRNIRRAAG